LPGDDLVQSVAEKNVDHVVREIREKSSVLEAMITAGQVGIVGAMYSVQSGNVQFQDLIRKDPQ
jgi:carbonic anhydrase